MALVDLRWSQGETEVARGIANETLARVEAARNEGALDGEQVSVDEVRAWLAEHP